MSWLAWAGLVSGAGCAAICAARKDAVGVMGWVTALIFAADLYLHGIVP